MRIENALKGHINGQPAMTSTAALIVAAGRGLRAGAGGPKQYRRLAGRTVIARSVAAFASHPQIARTQVVIHADDIANFDAAMTGVTIAAPVIGGASRQASVLAGLEALTAFTPDIVLIHDAARPFATPSLITRAIDAAKATGAAIPVIALTDTAKIVDAHGVITATADRAQLRLAQTPQAFKFDAILSAHRRAAKDGRDDFTDDASIAEWAGLTVATFEGDAANMKLTTADDFARAEIQLAGDIRTATGYDVHAFGPGDHVTICGVRIPFDRGVVAHSDGDVGLHALVDAILGALADGDIGTHFPPSDPQWKNAASDRFLTDACARVAARGGTIAHLDVTLVCEAPKIGPHRDAMRERIAAIAGIDLARVSVKATTSERLGFTGRGEGLAATATATIRLPWSAA
jgi:2-C-methyl-D-erythritol 4-phosphate cytidylyltransferase/2-C-methyl-D-erythritol 2,4-cyclodiphosphate synthase